MHLLLQFLIRLAQFQTVVKVEMEPIAVFAQFQLGDQALKLGFTVTVNAASSTNFSSSLSMIGRGK